MIPTITPQNIFSCIFIQSFKLHIRCRLRPRQEVLPRLIHAAIGAQQSWVALGEETCTILCLLTGWLASALGRVTADVVASGVKARTSYKCCVFGLAFGDVELSRKGLWFGGLVMSRCFRTARWLLWPACARKGCTGIAASRFGNLDIELPIQCLRLLHISLQFVACLLQVNKIIKKTFQPPPALCNWWLLLKKRLLRPSSSLWWIFSLRSTFHITYHPLDLRYKPLFSLHFLDGFLHVFQIMWLQLQPLCHNAKKLSIFLVHPRFFLGDKVLHEGAPIWKRFLAIRGFCLTTAILWWVISAHRRKRLPRVVSVSIH